MAELVVGGLTSTRPRRRQWKYDVFISFRGEDNHYGFTGHLYHNLERAGILTFMDDKGLRKGDSIGELFTAIEESRSAIVVFSQNFIRSSWCLDEVVKIMQCKKEWGQTVIPLFYHVEPREVRTQTGCFQLQEKVKVEVTEHEDVYGTNEEKIKEWGAALRYIGGISGYVFSDRHGYESELIEDIVRVVLRKLNRVMLSSCADKGFIGMDSRIPDLLHNYIQPQSGGVRIIGIHGMRGIGKTTLALAIHDEICQDYDGRCFLSNVRERSIKDGLVSLQEQLQEAATGLVQGAEFLLPPQIFICYRHIKLMLRTRLLG